MNFKNLDELLRLELDRRIERGELTQTSIARQAGFQQSHISNYLKRRRGLSLEALDRVLASQDLSLEQILSLDLRALNLQLPAAAMTIPIVTPTAAMDEPVIHPGSIIETIAVSAVGAWPKPNRFQPPHHRSQWQRFVAIRANGAQAAPMDPVIKPGTVVIIDRHYNFVAPYHEQPRPLYAVRTCTGLDLRYVDLDKHALMFRPLALNFSVEHIVLAPDQKPSEFLTGRAILILTEL